MKANRTLALALAALLIWAGLAGVVAANDERVRTTEHEPSDRLDRALDALAPNPLVWILLGIRRGLLGLGIGGFAFLPDLFAAVAVTVLLHQSYR